MSSGSISHSASGSLPENLGLGSSLTTGNGSSATGAVVLSAEKQAKLDKHLAVAEKIFSTPQGIITAKEIRDFDHYLTNLITEEDKADVVAYLRSQYKTSQQMSDLESPKQPKARAMNQLALFVGKLSQDHEKIATLESKFKSHGQLTYDECRLVDELAALSYCVGKLKSAGMGANPHVNQVSFIHEMATENAFKEFQDGDVLFFDNKGFRAYRGEPVGFLDKITMKSLGCPYTHVGVFYRDGQGRPCVAHIQGGYGREHLTFGQQSFIRGTRVDPSKFSARPLTGDEKLSAQKRIGEVFGNVVARQDWEIGITMKQQIKCVLISHGKKGNTSLELGKAKLEDGVDMLCSEFAGVGLVQAFDEYNKEQVAQVKKGELPIQLSAPFRPGEKASSLHPERLLTAMGPNQGTPKATSGWEEVSEHPTKGLPLYAMLPDRSSGPLSG